ncbi:P-II family nitrogen regulator [Mariprofundus erugo]|uniref:P-II family nitrogen regulator n=1 Tax=Mariprofundus erugo TaxID=2528639 RepID=A0A5R9GMR8_9PROT|nr:P-II family nitrogen regulator [Mariprofundus erugo]TLS66259.1 P-II family nitrogen regulator [Mariprofundus erugo]TLS78319.1 P-II family nitrogen regulator [Mariprofundus erugo]
MHFKLIIALVDDANTKEIMRAAREAGATGSTVIGSARGEGLSPKKTFFGLNLESQRDMLMFIVEEHLSREVLEHIAAVGGFDESPGSGLAFQLDVDDAIGLKSQIKSIVDEVEDNL